LGGENILINILIFPPLGICRWGPAQLSLHPHATPVRAAIPQMLPYVLLTMCL